MLRCLLERQKSKNTSWHITCSEEQYATLKSITRGTNNLKIYPFISRKCFLRENQQLNKFLETCLPDIYFTPDYLGACPVQIKSIIVVHDIFRILKPKLGYSDQGFVDKFGEMEFKRIYTLAATEREKVKGFIFSAALSYLQKEAIKHSTAVCSPSFATRDKLIEWVPEFSSKFYHLPSSFDKDRFQSSGKVKFNGKYFLFVGGSNRIHKGWSRILDAFRNTGVASIGWKLICVGSKGNDADERSGIIFKEQVSDDDLGDLYRGCSALLVGSEDEGFCLPVLEARAFGKIVIAPDIPAIRESSAGQALFYSAADHQELVRLIKYITTVPSSLATSSLTQVDYQPDWDLIESKWWEVVNTVLNE